MKSVPSFSFSLIIVIPWVPLRSRNSDCARSDRGVKGKQTAKAEEKLEHFPSGLIL